MFSFKPAGLLFIVLLISFVTKFIGITQSFWLDEAVTANTIAQFSYLQLITQFAPTDFHPPFYYLVIKTWSSIFGTSEIALRSLSVICITLAGYILFLAGRTLGGPSTGLWASALFIFNPLITYYAQEARMYALVTLLIALNFYAYLNVKAALRPHLWLGILVLTSALMLTTFYGSMFYLAALIVWSMYKKYHTLAYTLALSTLCTLLLLAPLLFTQLTTARILTQEVTHWKSVLGRVEIKNLALIPLKFATGRISFEPKTGYYLLGFISVIVMTIAVYTSKLNRMLLFFAAFPLFLATFTSFITPMLQYFRYLYLIIFISLLSAGGVKIARFLLLTISILWSFAYLLNPAFHREDWKGLVQKLPTEEVYIIASSSDPLRYYNKNLVIYDLKITNFEALERAVIIPYTSDIHGVDYAASLTTNGFKKMHVIAVQGLSAEIWEK